MVPDQRGMDIFPSLFLRCVVGRGDTYQYQYQYLGVEPI